MRRLFVAVLIGALLGGCATPKRTAPVVAVLLADDVRMPKVEGLRTGLAELGYPAESLRLEVLSSGADRAVLKDLARQAMALEPDVLVAGGGIEALTLKEAAGGHTPVVMMGVASPVRSGLVESLVRPGGNVTGLDNQHAELSGKRLELLTKLLPGVRRVLLLYDPQVIPGVHALAVTQNTAHQLGIAVEPVAAGTQAQAVDRLRALAPGEFDAALLLPGYVLESGARQFSAELERLRLPAMGPLDLEGEAGLLAAYGVSMRDQGAQSARFVVKLLQGVAPASIPVETPDNPELVVDLRVAGRLGLELSPVGLAFARTIGGKEGDLP